MFEIQLRDLGSRDYKSVEKLQKRLVKRLQDDPESPAQLLLVEHNTPVITMGRRAKEENILVTTETLQEQGVEVHKIRRGGDVTWHGPGQLVGYPILPLKRCGLRIRDLVEQLEGAILDTLAAFDIEAKRRDGFPGVWVAEKKIAAIGIAVDHWVSYHGFSLNVGDDLSGYDLIRPCGLEDGQPTSISKLLEKTVTIEQVKAKFLEFLAPRLQMQIVPLRKTLPPWFRKPLPALGESNKVRGLVEELGLHTVCTSAHCPNLSECYSRGTATFLILGDHCTRNCRFCAVESGKLLPPREDEPLAIAEATERLALRHLVITSVTRDDLPDGGSQHFAKTIRKVRSRMPQTTIEVLTPDFLGDSVALNTIFAAKPDVFNHNVETVERLYSEVRPLANYARSLEVLRRGKEEGNLRTKSGIMLGLGETDAEVEQVLRDLRSVGCDALTIGQYLAPSSSHHPVARFIPPEEFDAWKKRGEAMGFLQVPSAPNVRSSYRAEKL